MLEQLQNLDQKDRRALVAGSVAVVAALVWFAILAPLHHATEEAAGRFDGALDSHRKVQDISNTLRDRGISLPDQVWSITEIETATAELLGSDVIIDIRESGPMRADVAITDIDYDQLIELLLVFEQLGLFVEQADVTPEDDGQSLSINLTIGR